MGTIKSNDFEISPTVEFGERETADAKDYWSSIEFAAYERPKVWSAFMAERVMAFKPRSVFEFGCNSGKNLNAVESLDRTMFVAGIDINSAAVGHGRGLGRKIAVGDEENLNIFPDQCFDVSFTVSVLDHLPFPEKAFKNLLRMSHKAVLLLEPWLGYEGKVVRNTDLLTKEIIDTTPYSYSWDYARLHGEFAPDWQFVREDYRLKSNLGRFYGLFTFTRKGVDT
jgi:SAM-dependent methyltransferase